MVTDRDLSLIDRGMAALTENRVIAAGLFLARDAVRRRGPSLAGRWGQATISCHGVVCAAGTARTLRRRMSVRLTPLRSNRDWANKRSHWSAGGRERITSKSWS